MEPLPQEIKEIFPYRHRFVEIGKERMHYVDEGSGEVVVMLHGNPTWSFYYRNVIAGLKNEFRCVAPDHIGCGLSSKPQRYRYTLAQHIQNFEDFIDKLGFEKFNLIVHDWGGAIGMGYATRHPERINRIVITNTAAFRYPKLSKRIAFIRLPIIRQVLIRGLNMFPVMSTYMSVERRMAARVEAGFLHPYNNWNNRIGVEQFVKDIPMHKWDRSYNTLVEIEEKLSVLQKHQMLICWASNDFCFHRGIMQEWIRRFPRAKARRFISSGHYLFEDAKDETVRRIHRFLKDL